MHGHEAIPAVSVALKRGDTLLLVRRRQSPSQGLYAFPGGKVEEGETLEQAARRELMEETGLQACGLTPMREYVFGGRRDGKTVRYRLTVFSGRHAGGEAVAGDDAESAGWFDLAAMAALPMPDSVREVAHELLVSEDAGQQPPCL